MFNDFNVGLRANLHNDFIHHNSPRYALLAGVLIAQLNIPIPGLSNPAYSIFARIFPFAGTALLAYVEQVVVPSLRPDDIVVIDNLSAQKLAAQGTFVIGVVSAVRTP